MTPLETIKIWDRQQLESAFTQREVELATTLGENKWAVSVSALISYEPAHWWSTVRTKTLICAIIVHAPDRELAEGIGAYRQRISLERQYPSPAWCEIQGVTAIQI